MVTGSASHNSTTMSKDSLEIFNESFRSTPSFGSGGSFGEDEWESETAATPHHSNVHQFSNSLILETYGLAAPQLVKKPSLLGDDEDKRESLQRSSSHRSVRAPRRRGRLGVSAHKSSPETIESMAVSSAHHASAHHRPSLKRTESVRKNGEGARKLMKEMEARLKNAEERIHATERKVNSMKKKLREEQSKTRLLEAELQDKKFMSSLLASQQVPQFDMSDKPLLVSSPSNSEMLDSDSGSESDFQAKKSTFSRLVSTIKNFPVSKVA